MPIYSYEIPDGTPGDPWERLSTEAGAALGRTGIDAGAGPARELLPDTPPEPRKLAERVGSAALNWARAELTAGGAESPLSVWKSYEDHGALHQRAPDSLEHLLQLSPNLSSKVERLYAAWSDIRATGEITPHGELLSDTLKTVLIPWRTIQKHLHDLPLWADKLQKIKDNWANPATEQAYTIDIITAEVVAGNTLFYRAGSPVVKTWDYVAKMRRSDGLWGIGLMQTGTAGLQSIIDSGVLTPDTICSLGSRPGAKPLYIGDHRVSCMGILEWLSLSLQEDVENQLCWLPANRLYGTETSFVPQVFTFKGIGTQISLMDAGEPQVAQPRLAIV